jgi:hypothetical protein
MREQQGAAARVLSELGVTHDRVQRAVRFIIGEGEHAVADDITLTPRAKNVVELAIAEARALAHDAIDTEHLLLALLREGEGVAVGVLESLGIDLSRVWANTYRILGIPPGLRPELPSTRRWRDQNVRILRERLNRRRVWSIQGYSQVVGPLVGLPSFTTGAISALEEAELTAWWLHHQQVEPAHLLVGLIREHEGIAAQALRHVAVTEQLADAELERLLPKGRPPAAGAAIDMSPAFQQVLEDAHHMLAASVGPPTPASGTHCRQRRRLRPHRDCAPWQHAVRHSRHRARARRATLSRTFSPLNGCLDAQDSTGNRGSTR